MTRFGAQSMSPGIIAARETIEAQLWFGKWEQQKFQGGVILSSTVDAGHPEGQTTQLRPGLVLGQFTSGANAGLLTTWNPYAATKDGTNRIAGILNHHIEMTLDGTASNRYTDLLFYGGNVKADEILIPGEAAAGVSGKAWEFLLREQLKHRFVFDDDIYGELTADGKTWEFTGTDAAETFTIADHNTLITNRESTVTATATLPAPVPGLKFRFAQIGVEGTGQDLIFQTDGVATDFILGTDDTVASVTIDALNFITAEVVGVRVTDAAPDTYKYMVTLSGSV